ncbi:MAG TPA: enoyl-CoA hydratase/isomerase family protein [Egibacteraceae bacterium]|nr:enoyl-CoA hydratase/isomerase family protein [Egibacteraceae bacterium]
MAELVDIRDRDGARVLSLQRAEKRNALSTELLTELLDAIGDAARDEAVRVIVFTGSGGAFSAGKDLREELDLAGRVRRSELLCGVYEAVGSSSTPTIAAVEGPCVGGGAELAAACDLRVAGAGATFRFPGAALGFPVGPAKLIGLVGLGAAKDLVLTARWVEAEEAQRIGLVQRVVGTGEALSAALEIAADILANDPEALTCLKRQFNRFSGLGDRIAAENDALRALAESDGDFGALRAPKPGVSGR